MNKITFRDANGRPVVIPLPYPIIHTPFKNLADNERVNPPTAEREKPNTSYKLDADTLELLKLNWQELHQSGALIKLHSDTPQVFAYLYHKTFGKYPSNVEVDTSIQAAITAAVNDAVKNLSYSLDKKTLEMMLEGYDTLFKRGDLQVLLDEKPQIFAFLYHDKFGKYPDSVPTDMYIQEGIATQYNKALLTHLSDMSFDELYRTGRLNDLKDRAPYIYERKLKERR